MICLSIVLVVPASLDNRFSRNPASQGVRSLAGALNTTIATMPSKRNEFLVNYKDAIEQGLFLNAEFQKTTENTVFDEHLSEIKSNLIAFLEEGVLREKVRNELLDEIEKLTFHFFMIHRFSMVGHHDGAKLAVTTFTEMLIKFAGRIEVQLNLGDEIRQDLIAQLFQSFGEISQKELESYTAPQKIRTQKILKELYLLLDTKKIEQTINELVLQKVKFGNHGRSLRAWTFVAVRCLVLGMITWQMFKGTISLEISESIITNAIIGVGYFLGWILLSGAPEVDPVATKVFKILHEVNRKKEKIIEKINSCNINLLKGGGGHD